MLLGGFGSTGLLHGSGAVTTIQCQEMSAPSSIHVVEPSPGCSADSSSRSVSAAGTLVPESSQMGIGDWLERCRRRSYTTQMRR